jgi:hypothetical protein
MKRMPASVKGSTELSPSLITEKLMPQMAVISMASSK